MKHFLPKSRHFAWAFFWLLTTTIGWGQVFESFETGLPTSYNSNLTSYNLNSGSWLIKDVISSNNASYIQSGSLACQIRSATDAQIISPTLVNGVETISFYVTASTTSGSYQVNVSTDNGLTFSPAVGSPFSISTTKTLRVINLNNSNINKIQIRRTAATIYLDDIEITPIQSLPTITFTGSLFSLNTTFGQASSNTSFDVSGTNMEAGITITPPVGFEVSTTSDFSTTIGNNSSPLVVGAAGTIASTTIYVRLSATANAGTYSGNIVLSSTNATSVNVATASSTINKVTPTVNTAPTASAITLGEPLQKLPSKFVLLQQQPEHNLGILPMFLQEPLRKTLLFRERESIHHQALLHQPVLQ